VLIFFDKFSKQTKNKISSDMLFFKNKFTKKSKWSFNEAYRRRAYELFTQSGQINASATTRKTGSFKQG